MRIDQFRLGQWWVSNDWAIKLKKISKGYEVWVVYEKDVCIDNLPASDDPIVNMARETFLLMLENDLFKEFIKDGGSILKASDVSTEILDHIAKTKEQVYEMKKKELVWFLWWLELGEKRYMWEWQDKYKKVERVRHVLDDISEDGENQ